LNCTIRGVNYELSRVPVQFLRRGNPAEYADPAIG